MTFDEIFDLTAGVYFIFFSIIEYTVYDSYDFYICFDRGLSFWVLQ